MRAFQPVHIHIADDDADDRLMVSEAFEEARLDNKITFSVNGQDLMDYLNGKGEYVNSNQRLPDLILLDLNMPLKDGREALKEIKSSPELCHIPVVVLTTSRAEEDVLKSYKLGTNSFIVKPLTFEKMIEAVNSFTDYWLSIVKLPGKD